MFDAAELNPPIHDESGHLVLKSVGLPLRAGAFDLTLDKGTVTSIEAHADRSPAWLCLPALADLHVHANRAFTLGGAHPQSLSHAIELTQDIFATFDEERYARHAQMLFEQGLAKGTTRFRTHADIDPSSGLKALRGTLDARDAMKDRIDVEIVAFASSINDPIQKEVKDILRTAIDLGATHLGAVPNFYPDPARSIAAMLDLASELGVPVDVHLDEHLDAALSASGALAKATLDRGLQGRVTLSHGCAISTLAEDARKAVIDALAQVGITVIALPATNLYLQDRGAGTPQRRGLTSVLEMARAGVPLRFASDNVQDVFYPYGNADLLDIAQLTASAAHVDDMKVLLSGICDGRADIQVGDAACLTLVKEKSFESAIAERPQARAALHKGRVVNPLPLADPTSMFPTY